MLWKCISTRREGRALPWASRTSYSTTHTWHKSAHLKPPQWRRSYLTVQSDSWGPGEVCDLDKTETCHRTKRTLFYVILIRSSWQYESVQWVWPHKHPHLWQFGEFFLRSISPVKPGKVWIELVLCDMFWFMLYTVGLSVLHLIPLQPKLSAYPKEEASLTGWGETGLNQPWNFCLRLM